MNTMNWWEVWTSSQSLSHTLRSSSVHVQTACLICPVFPVLVHLVDGLSFKNSFPTAIIIYVCAVLKHSRGARFALVACNSLMRPDKKQSCWLVTVWLHVTVEECGSTGKLPRSRHMTRNTYKKNMNIIKTKDTFSIVSCKCVYLHTVFLQSAFTDLHTQMSQLSIW